MSELQVQALYEAAFDRTEPHRLAALLSSALDGRSAALAVMDGSGGVDPICWDYFSGEAFADGEYLAWLLQLARDLRQCFAGS